MILFENKLESIEILKCIRKTFGSFSFDSRVQYTNKFLLANRFFFFLLAYVYPIFLLKDRTTFIDCFVNYIYIFQIDL